jgi:hypothetical protein
MRKPLCIALTLHMIFLWSGLAFSGDNRSNQEGKLNLTDSGGRPGVPSVQVAWKTVVAYTGAANAAAYEGTAGQVMCCVAGHPDGHPLDALYFAVRASQMRDQVKCPDDSSIYQVSAGGTYCNIEQCETYLTTNIADTWHSRPGGGSGS